MANNYPVSGVMTQQIFTTFDAGKPQVHERLTARYGNQYEAFFLKFAKMGREEAVKAYNWKLYEDNWIHEDIIVKTTTGNPGAGTSLAITLATTRVDDNNHYYPRVGDVVTIPGTLVQAWISAIDPTTPTAPIITLMPFRAADNIGAIAENTHLSITSGAFGEGTGQPKGTVRGTIQRDFNTQIIKETVGLDGSQFINELWFTKYENGEVAGYFTTGTLAAEYLFKLKSDGALTVGVPSDNASMVQARVDIHGQSVGENSTVRTTWGMVPLVKLRGNSASYTAGSYDLEDLDDQGLYLRSQGVNSGVVYAPKGARLYNDIQTEAKDYAVDATGDGQLINSVVSVLGKGNKELATSLMFKYINRGNFTYSLDVIDVWSHPKYLGNTGYDMDKKGFWIPMRTVKDSKTNLPVDNMHIKYRSNDAYNRRAEMWSVRGAGGGTYVTDVDRAEWYIRGEFGLGMAAVNQMTWEYDA
jgi:hypothetical protein